MLSKVDAVAVLLFLFVFVTAMNYFKIQPDQTLLATILLALSVNGATKGGPLSPA